MAKELKPVAWNLIVIDEAHKLRNAHQESNRIGKELRWALDGRRKVLLSATPLQNSLTELYGLSTLIDEQIFGDLKTFRSVYATQEGDLGDLRDRLSIFCRRTLRRDVTEFIRYTARRLTTIPFEPSGDELEFYEAFSPYLQRSDTYAFPKAQKNMMILMMRKILASSRAALEGTLLAIRQRLEGLQAHIGENLREYPIPDDSFEEMFGDGALMVAEAHAEYYSSEEEKKAADAEQDARIERDKLRAEISEIDRFLVWSRSLGTDSKTQKLLRALEIGYEKAKELGAEEKAVIFTESRRSMEYLRNYLEANGYAGEVVCFSGGGKRDPQSEQVYQEYMAENRLKEDVNTSGSKQVMLRHALIERFRSKAKILIVTEAGAEGINLQFCSLVINYDLPWNPQRIEQRIGRCHRYGQKHDVVVINFLNQRNAADLRVYDLLEHKYQLFDGVFGASDDVLSDLDGSAGLEIKIAALYDKCRTEQEIKDGFDQLQQELERSIAARIGEIRQRILENLDEEVHRKIKIEYDEAIQSLDEYGRKFWAFTKLALKNYADFDDEKLSFTLHTPPIPEAALCEYILKPKMKFRDDRPLEFSADGALLYRMNSGLGEWVLDFGKHFELPCRTIEFDLSGYPSKISVLEELKGKSGFLLLNKLTLHSLESEDFLLFTGFEEGSCAAIPHDVLMQLFKLDGRAASMHYLCQDDEFMLQSMMQKLADQTVAKAMEKNHTYFREQSEKLQRWVEDCVKAAERELEQIQVQIKEMQRQIAQAMDLEIQCRLEQQLATLTKERNKARSRIFDVEDEIAGRRDELIAAMKRKLTNGATNTPLFMINWKIV